MCQVITILFTLILILRIDRGDERLVLSAHSRRLENDNGEFAIAKGDWSNIS